MATYAIGDVQGCAARLDDLLARILATEPDAQFIFVGDLVNRGPDSLGSLRTIRALAERARVILGNHDHSNRVKRAVGWATVDGLLHINVDGQPLVLCHYAMRVWNRSHYGAIQLYGHSHGNLPGDAQSLDVGVDCWSFAPTSLAEIKERLSTQVRRVEPDHHTPREAAA